MKFDKEHLVDIKSLTKSEAEVFLGFLSLEKQRHIETASKCSVWVRLWQSEWMRQVDEVKHIDGGIEEVKKKFKLEEK